MKQLELFPFDPQDNNACSFESYLERFRLPDGSYPGDLDDAKIFELWMNGELPDLDCGYERRAY